jgi:hypothetical protein
MLSGYVLRKLEIFEYVVRDLVNLMEGADLNDYDEETVVEFLATAANRSYCTARVLTTYATPDLVGRVLRRCQLRHYQNGADWIYQVARGL